MKVGIPDAITRQVILEGFTPIMFDRFSGDMKTALEPMDKLYYIPGTMTVSLPALNLKSFLSAKNTTSVAKQIGGRGYGALADAFLSFTQINPDHIPICRDGNPIEFHGFKDGVDDIAKIHVERHVARLAKGIPNPKERPVIELPWEISFSITMFKNKDFDETLLLKAFEQGGASLGIGTFRGVYGKFFVKRWE